ncbi:MAG TPA: hypothetical protein VF815_13955 [Myxococcaceae bacterium]|jgi:hypothetical protein
MKRSGFVAAALALGGLLGAAEVRSASNEHQKSLEAFKKKALSDRRAQGLDKNEKALYEKYPTPEVQLVGGGGGASILDAPAGTETTLTATGRFVPGSFAHINCVNVQVLSQKVTETKLEVRVRVAGAALPGMCDMVVYSPVSLANEGVSFRITGSHQWELATANGLKVRMRTSSQKDSNLLSATTDWFSKDGKPLGTRQASVESNEQSVTVNVMRSEEELQNASKAWRSTSSNTDMADAQKEAKAIQEKMKAECMKLAGEKMGACIQKYTAQLQATTQKMQNANKATQEKADAGAVGCQSMKLQVVAGKVSGQGTSCGAPGEVAVTGTVTVSK